MERNDDRENRSQKNVNPAENGSPSFHSPLKKGGAARRVVSIALAILVASLVRFGIKEWRTDSNAETANTKEVLRRVAMEELANADNYDAPLKRSEVTSGEPMVNIVVAYMRGMTDRSREYTRKLDEAGLYGLFDTERLTNDRDLSQSRDIMTKSLAAFREHKSSCLKLFESLRLDVDSAIAKNRNTRELRTFKSMLTGDGLKPLEFALELEEKILLTLSEVVDFWESTKGTWQVVGDGIYFDKDEDMEKYNSILEKLNKLQEEQEALHAQYNQSAMELLK